MDAFDREYAEAIQQGSEQWANIRLGRFTSSEFYKLMDFGKRPMTEEELAARPKKGKGSSTTYTIDYDSFTDAALTYIDEKIAEVLTGRPNEEAYSRAMEYGKELEPEAAKYFEELTGLETHVAGFVPYTDHAGGSPDRFIEDNAGIEIKCPYNPVNQIRYIRELKTEEDLKRLHPDYYWQVKTNLLFSDRKLWYFVTFDPRMKMEKHKMKIITLTPNEEEQEFITNRLIKATEKKLQRLQELI